MTPLFTLDELRTAAVSVRTHLQPTPSITHPLLAAEIGAEVVVKHENVTPVGAFKVRGGIVHLERLLADRPGLRGVASATTGNHGQSLARAARLNGVEAVIVVPEGNGADKNAAMEALGAELIVHGADFDAARRRSVEVAAERGLQLVPPFHPDLVLGVATYALELFENAGPLDTVFVPVGMGSGICALITVRDLLGLRTGIVGVCTAAAPAQALTFAAGEVVTTDGAPTFVDGVATSSPDPTASAIIAAGADDVMTVTEDEAAEAVRRMWRTTHHLVEPAGALAVAGLWNRRDTQAGKRVAVIASGANMDTSMAATILAGATPRKGGAAQTPISSSLS